MNAELIRTLQIIDENEKKTVKELSMLLTNFDDNLLLEAMVNFNNFSFDFSIMKQIDMNARTRNASIYILKEENEKQIYGVAIITSNENNSTSCCLYHYAIKSEYNTIGLYVDFMKIICENLKNRGFSEMVLIHDDNSNFKLKSCIDKFGIDAVTLRINECIY